MHFSIKQREEEIIKINTNLEELKENNKNIFDEFNCFKTKFYELETDYDRSLQQLKEENLQLVDNFEKQKTIENQKIQQLSLNCIELEQKLQDNVKEFAKLSKLHLETVHNFETMSKDFDKQTNDFEIYKKQVNEERITNEEKIKEVEKLREELVHKDGIIDQLTLDKTSLEKAKNLVIDELNNKILRIERAFTQPSKAVQPVTNLDRQDASKTTKASYEDFRNSLSKIKPQTNTILADVAVNSLDDNENKKSDNNYSQRNYKFKHPVQPATDSPQTTIGFGSISNNRKRRNQPARQLTLKNSIYSSTSSDDEAEDSTIEYCRPQNLWRPSKRVDESYVPETDTSQGFAKSKRLRK
ncbi:hypothetical protein DOY81_000082 [Sarcophaga bullata]|nr:hypothetical protein DOY81_000082 [Sarcophaga bullata]